MYCFQAWPVKTFWVIHHSFSFSLLDTDDSDALGDGGPIRWKELRYHDGESCPAE